MRLALVSSRNRKAAGIRVIHATQAAPTRRWSQRTEIIAAGSLAWMLATCGSKPNLFADSGVANGTSVPFHVPDGIVSIQYEAADREPWFGCNFGVQLVAPEQDPLAPGRVVTTTDVFEVRPRDRTSGRLLSPPLTSGDYFLRYLGDKPCDWAVRVSGP
jgi:hypothetical protein